MGLIKRVALWFGAVAFATSCDPGDQTPSVKRGSDFFPLQVGSFYVYEVDSTHIRLNAESKFTFQLRVTVSGSFVNGEGNTTFTLQREKRATSADGWSPAGTWSAWVDARRAVLSEGNRSFVKLQFPIEEAIVWNGNAYNTLGGNDQCNGVDCDIYQVTEIDPEVVVTQSKDEDVLVKFDVRKEIYARNIGLRYKEMTVLEYCTAQNCFGKQFVDNGIKYKQSLLENGVL